MEVRGNLLHPLSYFSQFSSVAELIIWHYLKLPNNFKL